MISIKDIRTNSHNIKKTLKSKGYEGSINDIISLDENFRKLTHSLEKLWAKKNTVSDNKDSVPGVSKVPVIGKMFQGKSKSDTLNELLVFIAPRIL